MRSIVSKYVGVNLLQRGSVPRAMLTPHPCPFPSVGGEGDVAFKSGVACVLFYQLEEVYHPHDLRPRALTRVAICAAGAKFMWKY